MSEGNISAQTSPRTSSLTLGSSSGIIFRSAGGAVGKEAGGTTLSPLCMGSARNVQLLQFNYEM
jgi:hypothetical protein